MIALGFGGVAAALALGVIIFIWRDGKPQVVVVPGTDGTVRVESTKSGTSVTVTPSTDTDPPPPKVGRRVQVSVESTFGYYGKTGELKSGHQPMRGDLGTIMEVPDASVTNRWRVVWDADKSDPEGNWVCADYLKTQN